MKSQNIAEYLIYMWQVEDMLRANHCQMDEVKQTLVNTRTDLTDQQRQHLAQWYADLIDMMHQEGVVEKGHLQINKNVITWLTDLHLQLLRSPKFPYYGAAYFKALPFIVELRAKNANKEVPELETCFEALYGILLLKIQKKTVSTDTQQAQAAISALLSMLAQYYIADKQGTLFDD
ncbi:MAG: DUF4924 family protein [Bacteroidales bacterium]|nr:DUF4924 family protein [Bacteroidales bacterium]